MKVKINLILSGVALFLSFLLFVGSASVAWFSSYRINQSTGMSVQIESTKNLVIGKSQQELANIQELTNDWFSVTFDFPSTKLRPATHFNGGDYNLKYVTNTDQVDLSSGKQKQNKVLEYSPVISIDRDKYFKDYVVYISSYGGSLPIELFTARMESNIINQTLKATSVDFYLQGVYVVTANLGNNNSVVLINQDYLIPQNTDGAIQILMRFYFDGALQDQETQRTYINTNQINLDTKQIQLRIVFQAVDLQN